MAEKIVVGERQGREGRNVQRNDELRSGVQRAVPSMYHLTELYSRFPVALPFHACLCACLTMVTFAATGPIARAPQAAPASPPAATAAAVPPAVQRVLANVGCHRPAVASHTITKGHFVRASQEDWAAVCVSGGSSFIYVVWGGTVQCPSTLATQRTKDVPATGAARALATLQPDAIVRALRANGQSVTMKIDHDGIEDAAAGSAASIRYCLNQSWVNVR